jgi:hypothetical protein
MVPRLRTRTAAGPGHDTALMTRERCGLLLPRREAASYKSRALPKAPSRGIFVQSLFRIQGKQQRKLLNFIRRNRPKVNFIVANCRHNELLLRPTPRGRMTSCYSALC